MEEYLYKLKKIADYHINKFYNQGYANKGCNGLYKDIDTEMRNTAHWVVTYSILYNIFKEKKYYDIVLKFGEFLLKDDNYGKNGAAICRINSNDDTNGVIGQAWVIEGLLACYDITQNLNFINKAIKIFDSQKFVEEIGLWRICCSNGKDVGYDYVYNHNLWFAASGSLILQRVNVENIRKKIIRFLECSKYTYGVQPSGCLYHLVNLNKNIVGKIKFRLKMCLTDFNIGKFQDLNYLEKGYHLFDLYGFAILKNKFPNNEEFNSFKLNKAISYGENKETINKLKMFKDFMNKYSFPYNSPAFEYPYVSMMLGKNYDDNFAKQLLDFQFSELFDESTMMFSKNNEDPETLTARMYELMRFFQERNLKYE